MADLRDWIDRHRRSITLLSLIFSALILTIVTTRLLTMRSSAAYRENLIQSDIYLEEERYDAALQKLKAALSASRSSVDFLRIIKRGEQLKELGIADGFPGEVIRKGQSKFPGNQPLLALYVNYLLEQEEFQAAAAKALGLDSDRFVQLKIEAYLRGGINPGSLGGTPFLEDSILPLTPQAMADPQAMYQAGLLTGDHRYFVNAVLMYAALGDVDKAFEIAYARKELLASRGEALLLTRLAYDAGLFTRGGELSTLVRSKNDPVSSEVDRMLADLYFFSGEPAKSYGVLEMLALNSNDPGSGVYENLIALEHAHGVLPGGRVAGTDLRERAAEAYPGSEVLSGLLSSTGARMENQDFKDLNIFYFRNLPGSYRSDILVILDRYLSETGDFAIEDGINFFWDLYNQHPDDTELRNLLLYFLSIHDHRREIDQLITLNSTAVDRDINLYRGFLHFLNGEEDAARDYLQAASDAGSYAASFNLGRLELSRQTPRAAQNYFRLSRSQILTRSGYTAGNNALLYTKEYREILVYLTLSYLLNEQIDEARELMNELHALKSRHILMPRLEEMFAQTQRR